MSSERVRPEGYLTTGEYGKRMRPPRSRITIWKLCDDERIEGAIKDETGQYWIPKGAKVSGRGIRPASGRGSQRRMGVAEWAAAHGRSKTSAYGQIYKGRVPGARQDEWGWSVPAEEPWPEDLRKREEKGQ